MVELHSYDAHMCLYALHFGPLSARISCHKHRHHQQSMYCHDFRFFEAALKMPVIFKMCSLFFLLKSIHRIDNSSSKTRIFLYYDANASTKREKTTISTYNILIRRKKNISFDSWIFNWWRNRIGMEIKRSMCNNKNQNDWPRVHARSRDRSVQCAIDRKFPKKLDS